MISYDPKVARVVAITFEARTLRGKRKPAKRHFQQGDLDGLCGVYAIVNAVAHLCPALAVTDCERLFEVLMGAVRADDERRRPTATRGVERRQLLRLMRTAFEHVECRHGIALVVRVVPKATARAWSLDTLWHFLSARLGDACVATLGLGGRYDHWTLATAMTARQIRLRDSDGLHVINRAHCSTRASSQRRFTITADMVIVVCRLEWVRAPRP